MKVQAGTIWVSKKEIEFPPDSGVMVRYRLKVQRVDGQSLQCSYQVIQPGNWKNTSHWNLNPNINTVEKLLSSYDPE